MSKEEDEKTAEAGGSSPLKTFEDFVKAHKEKLAQMCMFFAGLILLIPHRIGMSRVNYVIKRYNLPISRAGLLLYKFHNPIEVSLTIGNVLGVIITIIATAYATDDAKGGQARDFIGGCMIVVLILMHLSSIYMYIIYVIGDEFGYLDHFYFSLILITLFDGFTNAFAFGLNAKDGASMLSAGIPISGALVSLLHNIYKFFSDYNNWDNFDYYVLRLQLIFNIITILINIILWSWDLQNHTTEASVSSIVELFEASHRFDWAPICMLAISLGTVYAFYPSIAPYSIIDYQYASVIELWILVISAIPTLVIALLDTEYDGKGKIGPSGKPGSDILLTGTNKTVDFSGNEKQITLTNIQVKHTATVNDPSHNSGNACSNSSFHPWKTSNDTTTSDNLTDNDKYWGGKEVKIPVNNIDLNTPDYKPTTITFKPYYNWFLFNAPSPNGTVITLTAGGSGSAVSPDKVSFSIINPSNWNTNAPTNHHYWWHLVWICAIFYILCIQIFMSMLHYPDCLLSCFFNDHPYYIGFISVLFNTVRETMQACGFSGAGKQCDNLHLSGKILFDKYPLSGTDNIKHGQGEDINTDGQVRLNTKPSKITFTGSTGTVTNVQATASGFILLSKKASLKSNAINGTIAATNKLITLFVMMFCVFTGDGYLQHYRRCCRDCWPTTGFTRGQSFRYWLRCGFKGGSKSFTTSFTDMYHRNIRPQIISYA